MQSFITKLPNSRLFRHILFVIIIFISQIIQEKWVVNTSFSQIYWLFVFKDTITDLLLFYCISYYIIPNITNFRLYPFLFLALFITYAIAYGSNFIMFRMIDDQNAYSNLTLMGYPIANTIKGIASTYKKANFIEGLFNGSILFITFSWYGSIVFAQVIIKALKDFYFLQLKNIAYQKELVTLELDFLKTQINPHFLFNTLNNIYSMIAYKDKLAADSIMHLSDMMRFTLYETNQDKVLLEKEVEFIENYLSLERIRHGKFVEVEYTIEGDLTKYEIAPFLLIAMIENAFKHGISPAPIHSKITIYLKTNDDTLVFKVENTKNIDFAKKNSGGVGLKNLNRRLVLLYPKNHTIDFQDSKALYSVTLTLDNILLPV